MGNTGRSISNSMRYLFIILLTLTGIVAKAQLPASTFPSRVFTGNTKEQWVLLDSPLVNPILDTFYARYPGTQIVRIQGGDTSLWFYGGNRRWFKLLTSVPTATTTWGTITGTLSSQTDLQTALNLKLNKTDTSNRWVTSAYRKTASDSVFVVIGGVPVFAFRDSIGVGGSGLTSVGLSMPSAFSVSGSPLTVNGTISVSGAGTTLQYIRGNGTLATFDTTAIPSFSTKVRGLLSGTSPITFNQATGTIGILNANSTGQKGAATFNNSDFTDNGSGLISLRNPSGASGVDTIYRTPGVDSIYYTIAGITYAIKDSIGSGGGGITSLNALTASSQTFATGTSGTDFNINSATSTHTFNIPTASATNRGLLSTTDWTTFNSKLSNITGLITAGTNVSLSGSGTSGSPYVINSSGGGSTGESIVGSIFKSSNFTSLSGFTNNGATVSATGGHLSFSGGNPFTQTLEIDSSRSIEGWVIGAKIKILNTSSLGPGLGWRSNSLGGAYSVMAHFIASSGTINLWVGNFSSSVATSPSSITINNNDTIECVVEFNKTVLTARMRNLTTNSASVSVTYYYSFNGSAAEILPNTGRLAIFNNGGSFDVDSLSAWSQVAQNPNIVLVGDSKLRGYTATIEGFRIGDVLNNYFRSAVILAGGGDRLEDMIRRYKEIIAVSGSATKVILGGCSNNIRVGQTSATYNHLYDSLVTILTGAGLSVYHTTGFWETGISQDSFRLHVYSTYAANKIIETLQPTSQPGLLASDNIHLNDAGQIVVENSIMRGMVVPNEQTQYNPGNTVISNQSTIYQPAIFRINGYADIYGTNTTSRLTITNTANASKFFDLNIDHATNVSFQQFSRQGSAQAYFGLGGITSGAAANDFTFRHDGGDMYVSSSSGIPQLLITNGGNTLINSTTTPVGSSCRFNVSQASSSQFIANFDGARTSGAGISGSINNTFKWFLGTGDYTTGANADDLSVRSENGVVRLSNAGTSMFIVNNGFAQIRDSLKIGIVKPGTSADSILVREAATGNVHMVAQNSIGGGITSINSQTGPSITLASGTSGTDFAISQSSNTITFDIPSASASNRGLVTTSAQSFTGLKTFNVGAAALYQTSNSAFGASGNTSGTTSPSILGLNLSGLTYTDNGTARTESNEVDFNHIGIPFITSSNAITYSNAIVASLTIDGAPSASGSTTISHPWAIYTSTGVSRFDGLAGGMLEATTDQTLTNGTNWALLGSTNRTFTLPALSTWQGRMFFIKNASSATLTVQRAGSDQIYDTSAVTSITIAAGVARIIIAGATYWFVN